MYYKVNKHVLSVDTSPHAALFEEGKPISYATQALTPWQKNHPQTEEAYAIRIGCKTFHEYICGKKLTLETT